MIQRASKTFRTVILPQPSTVQWAGFDSGDVSEAGNVVGSAGGLGQLQSLVTYANEPFAIRTNPATNQTAGYKMLSQGPSGQRNSAPVSNIPDSYHRAYFQWNVLPTNTDCAIFLTADISDNLKLHIHVNTAGRLVARGGNGTGSVLGTGGTALQQNTWYRVECRVGTGSNAPWEIRLAIGDGPSWTELSGTTSTWSVAGGTFECIWGVDINDFANTVDWYFANLYWSSTGFPGPGHTALLTPKADGFYVAGLANGAATRWQCIDNVPPADDVQFVNGIVGAGAYTAKVNGILKGTIKSLKTYARGKRDSTNANFNSRLRTNGLDVDTGTAGAGFPSYSTLIKIYDVNPFTLQPWLASDVNNLEVGFVQGSNGGPIRVSACFVIVDYMPG